MATTHTTPAAWIGCPYVWAHIIRRDQWGVFRFVAYLGPRGWLVSRPERLETPRTQQA